MGSGSLAVPIALASLRVHPHLLLQLLLLLADLLQLCLEVIHLCHVPGRLWDTRGPSVGIPLHWLQEGHLEGMGWGQLLLLLHLGHSCLVLLHQLIHVLLVLLQSALHLVLFPLQPAQLLLQLQGATRVSRCIPGARYSPHKPTPNSVGPPWGQMGHGPTVVHHTPNALTAALALARSSICRWRSSISTSMDLRALTAAAQVNSDSSSCRDGAQCLAWEQGPSQPAVWGGSGCTPDS